MPMYREFLRKNMLGVGHFTEQGDKAGKLYDLRGLSLPSKATKLPILGSRSAQTL